MEEGGGIKGVSNGPHVPGGKAKAGDMGKPIPENDEPILLAGIAGIDGNKVGTPVIPGVTRAGVKPDPGGGKAPVGAGTKGNWLEEPGTSGFFKVVATCPYAC